MIITQTPFRMSFFGGGTDMESFFRENTEIFRGGFPELTDRLAGLLDDTDFLTDLNERLSALGEAYVEDKDLMRMHFYKPDKVAALFHQFAKPYQNYAAREDFHWNEYKKFITEDEINAYFTRGSNYSDSRLAIYSFFLNHEDKKERADFLKDHYGIGGSSHALCGADDSHEDHDGRGIALERGAYGNPDASVHLNWNQAAGRIDRLIRDSEYLKPADYSRMPSYEREKMAMRVMGFYHHLPNDVERPYPQDLYHEEGRKALVEKLADFSPEQMDVIYSVAEAGGELEELLNPDFPPEQMQLIADVQNRTNAISRAAAEEALEPLTQQPMTPAEVNHARRQHNLPLDSGAETEQPAQPKQKPINFRITDDDLGAGGPKTKYKANVEAIRVLQTLDAEQRQATAEEQEILSRYVGWGGIPQAFDENNAEWSKEYAELQSLLTADEFKEARASTLNAFYTSPTVIKAMYEALDSMGLSKGNVLEPSCGVGNFMGLVPDSMEKIRMYGVELDSISGRIAQQLYQKNKIAVQGFETMQFPDSFFDCVVGNVPFGNYKVPDKRYDRHNFLIHDYFIAKSLDLVRPGGVVAVVTSSGTMDKKDSSVREYLANRADLVGAIRLPNNAFQRNAKTGVVADILFLQKRDRAAVERADWVDLGETLKGYSINQYFAQHPEMVLGEITTESTQYGKQETTVKPIEGADLAQQLKEAVGNIHATITEPEISDDELDVQEEPIPADPSVKNFSFTNVDGQIYYRENSFMNVDKDRLVRFNGFFPKPQSGTYLILDEGGYQVAGQKGTWLVSDEVEVDGQRFVQMRSEQTKNPPPSIILHESGAFVTQTALGFDGEATRKMSAFLQGPKPELLHHQKFFENGTAERAKESGTEQNYNMIDGCVNNVPKKPRRIGGRWSVLDRLHIKQAERRQKDNAPQQEQERSRKS